MSTESVSNLLLVEDNAQDVDLLRHCLQSSEVDAHVTQVADLKDAITACKRQQFDVVLLDLNLPDSRGQNTAAEFCGIFSNIPTVILSGLSEQQMGANAIAQGAQDYISKDELTPAQLHRAIRYSICRHDIRSELRRRNDDLFKELDHQIQQSRIKFNLISAATHQLKGPLSLIRVCLEALQLANVEPDHQKRLERLGQMQQSLVVVFEFLEAIQVTSVSSGYQPRFTPSELSIKPFCQEIITELVKQGVDCSGVKLQIEDLVEAIQLDPILLRYILSNLLSNAVKYSPSGESIELNVSRDKTGVRLVVLDHGIGIPEDEISKILNPFYRATNARIAQSGSGLGLSIVQNSVELHQGQLDIETHLGQGTKVSIFLPLQQETADG